jgi:tRNA uridine 5-carboxymethylaminomethyl modification enzyme
VIDDVAWEAFERRRSALDDGIARAQRTRTGTNAIAGERFENGSTIGDALRRPNLGFDDVAAFFEPPLEPSIGERVAIEIKCAGYVRRQELAIEKALKTERIAIPDDFEYGDIVALSREAREKLSEQRPRTLGSAARIPGVTPADAAILSLFVHRARETVSQ